MNSATTVSNGIRTLIRFWGQHGGTEGLSRSHRWVDLFLERQFTPIHRWEGLYSDSRVEIFDIDHAFHDFVEKGDFSKVESGEVRAALELSRAERQAGTTWKDRRFAFLPSAASDEQKIGRKLDFYLVDRDNYKLPFGLIARGRYCG